MANVETIRRELRDAIVELNNRGLYQSTKWIAEQLVGLPLKKRSTSTKEEWKGKKSNEEFSDSSVSHYLTPNEHFSKQYSNISSSSIQKNKFISLKKETNDGKKLIFTSSEKFSFSDGQTEGFGAKSKEKSTPKEKVSKGELKEEEEGIEEEDEGEEEEEEEDEEDEDAYLFGKSLFDVREYRRAAYVLRNAKKGKSFFLYCYSKYLAGEKRKEEEMLEQSDKEASGVMSQTKNHEVASIENAFCVLYNDGSLDPFCAYLYGKMLMENERREEAMDMLCFSVNRFPYNWAAWQELQSMCSDPDAYLSIKKNVSNHWMFDFFEASVHVDLRGDEKGVEAYERLHDVFPESNYIICQLAIAKYNLIAFNEAESLFDELCHRDPYRIDGIDIFSNILYVKENLTSLSYLAHKVILIDKYRAETCCIIGNYYSLKGFHDKALLYFQRALNLNRKYLSAWTLMGHEFVEIKNISAAIHAYRQAVELNANDYRAWYGLGQTYEILGMPYYAIYYFRKASQLRPKDARMWQALGNCYENERLSLFHSSMECYKRAVECDDKDGVAMFKLAKLYESFGEYDPASRYFTMFIDLMDKTKQDNSPEIIHSLLFLAMHYKLYNELEKAERYCDRLMHFTGPAKESAKALLREIRSLQKHVKAEKQVDEKDGQSDKDDDETLEDEDEVKEDKDADEDDEDENEDDDEDADEDDEESGVEYDDSDEDSDDDNEDD